MNCILRTALAITIVVGFGGTHASEALWACGGACSEGGGHINQEIIQAKAEVKGEKAEAIKDPVCGMEVSDIKRHRQKSTTARSTTFALNTAKRPLKKTLHPMWLREHINMMRVKDTSIKEAKHQIDKTSPHENGETL